MRRSLVVSSTSAKKHCDPCYQLMKISEIQRASFSMVSMYHLRQLHPTLQGCEHLAIEIEEECADRRWAHAEVVAPSVADRRAMMWKITVDRGIDGATRKGESSCRKSSTNLCSTMLNWMRDERWEIRDERSKQCLRSSIVLEKCQLKNATSSCFGAERFDRGCKVDRRERFAGIWKLSADSHESDLPNAVRVIFSKCFENSLSKLCPTRWCEKSSWLKLTSSMASSRITPNSSKI